MRLNQYLSHAGICSRRTAVEYIKRSMVTVNGEPFTNPAYVIQDGDCIQVNGSEIKLQKRMYLLLNKPKNYLSTLSDTRGRKTVIELLGSKIKSRVYPIGRLDRDTTGLLIMTNDGEFTQRLAHPRNGVKKIYHAILNAELKHTDKLRLKKGVRLEDGVARVDAISFIGEKKRNAVRVELHSGRYRVIRRMFKALGYEVVKLDRVAYAGLRKNKLPLGAWRYLTQQEITGLKKCGSTSSSSASATASERQRKPLRSRIKRSSDEKNRPKFVGGRKRNVKR